MKSLRIIISTEIRALEQGKFQELCQALIPILDHKYQGMERFGGTVEGKTRKGVPDVIKTDELGNQIAIECSTEENYWKIQENHSQWKPCKDIDKCLERLKKPREIILCSNKEVPTNCPNAKSEIIKYAQNKSSVPIRLFCLADFEQILSENIENPLYQKIFEQYLPDTYKILQESREHQKDGIAIKLQLTKAIGLNESIQLAEEACQKYISQKDREFYALNKAADFKSKFEREKIPTPGFIDRKMPDGFPLLKPFGKIQTLLGIPKIGKTSLIAKICEKYEKDDDIDVHWFNCPDEREEASFTDELLRNIWSSFILSEKAADVANGFIKIDEIDHVKDKIGITRPAIYILDNAELLTEKTIKTILSHLQKIKKYFSFDHIGIIFISNKGLKHVFSLIDEETAAPAWSLSELKSFLIEKIPEDTLCKDDNYLQQIEIMSAGHPLIALALARKYPSYKELVVSSLITPPSITDEDLEGEVKDLLFNDIINNDPDLMNFVLCVSALIYSTTNKVLEAIVGNKFKPISKPLKLILEKLSGTVVEGDNNQGYKIAFVYKEVAKKYLESEDYTKIYDLVSLSFLDFKEKTLDAIKVCQGIMYSILARNFERAFFWAIRLMQSTINSKLTKEQIKGILDRLIVLQYLTISEKPLMYMYTMVLSLLAMLFSRIGNNKKALEIVNKISIPESNGSESDNKQTALLTEMMNIQRMMYTVIDKPEEGIKKLLDINFNVIKDEELAKCFPVDSLLDGVTPALPFKSINKALIDKLFRHSDLENPIVLGRIISIGINIAAKAKIENVSLEEALSLFENDKPIPQLVRLLIEAQYFLEDRPPEEACSKIEEAISFAKEKNIFHKTVENNIVQLKADILYKLKKYPEAKKAYEHNLTGLEDENFDYGWANYRLGLLAGDPIEAEKYFVESSRIFNKLRPSFEGFCAKSEGERGIALVQMGKYGDFARIAEWILRRYYIQKQEKFAPVAMIVLAQLTRLIHLIKEEPLTEKDGIVFPKFERGVYARVLDEAEPKKNAGMAAFYSLNLVYGLLGNTERKIKCLRSALSFGVPNDPMFTGIQNMVIKDLLSSLEIEKNSTEMEEIIVNKIFEGRNFEGKDRTFLMFCLFNIFDDTSISSFSKSNVLLTILNDIEKRIREKSSYFSEVNLLWWLSEIYKRKAKLAKKTETKSTQANLWHTAYINALKSSNYHALIDAGHYTGFVFYDNIFTRRGLAEIHFNILRVLSEQNYDISAKIIFGSNLCKLWSNILFRRNAEYDTEVKTYLMDNAKLLKNASFLPEEAAPIMILLLAKLFNYTGQITEWASQEIGKIGKVIPKEIRDIILPHNKE